LEEKWKKIVSDIKVLKDGEKPRKRKENCENKGRGAGRAEKRLGKAGEGD